jgi:hypothetical protein
MQITARLRNHLFQDRMPAAGPNMQPPFGSIDSQFGAYMGSHESPSLFHNDFMGRPLDGISTPWTTKVSTSLIATTCVAILIDAMIHCVSKFFEFLAPLWSKSVGHE